MLASEDPFRVRWRLGLMAALAITIFSLVPQINFWRARGDQWQGSFYSYHPDEYSYATYVNALMNGQPRRTDPYSGPGDSGQAALPESVFSMQFIPAYVIAIPARATRISAATAFIILTPISAFLSGLAIFLLVSHLTRDSRIAAASVLVVLCLGSFARGQWLIALTGGSPLPPIPFPFLRRYDPALPFPLFFVFCFLVWKMLTARSRVAAYLSMTAAGATFGVLVFSYFYLWTAAAAVLANLLVVFVVRRPSGWGTTLKRVGLLMAIGGMFVIPWLVLVWRRHDSVNRLTELTVTHSPDFRPVTLFSLALAAFLIIGIRKGWIESSGAARFTIALAMAPLVMLNQQLLTGLSLQPQHYESFIANYVLLVALSITPGLFVHSRIRKALSGSLLACISLAAILYGGYEVSLASTSRVNVTVDQFMPVASRLAGITKGPVETAIVVHPVFQLPDVLPSIANVSVLWAPHTFASGSSTSENKARYFQQLYYSNATPEQEPAFSLARVLFRQNVFGWGRAAPGLSVNSQPITAEEEAAAFREYAAYVAAFDRERVLNPQISYVIISGKLPVDLSRVDLWYERDQGERVGEFILYRVKPKPSN